jgi:hypothetical protein
MPHAFKGVCYGDSASSLEAFRLSFPWISENYVVWHGSSSASADGSFLLYSAYRYPLSGGVAPNINSYMYLAPCDHVDLPYDYMGAGGIWSFFFIFVLSLYLIAKSAGAVINAVRHM